MAELAPDAACARKRKSAEKARRTVRGPANKQGARKTDVKPKTLALRVKEHAGEGLERRSGQLFCTMCKCDCGSGKQACAKHVDTPKHQKAKREASSKVDNRNMLRETIKNFKASSTDDARFVEGMDNVSMNA